MRERECRMRPMSGVSCVVLLCSHRVQSTTTDSTLLPTEMLQTVGIVRLQSHFATTGCNFCNSYSLGNFFVLGCAPASEYESCVA
ncbi:hypothetical protein BKA69DRAFT_140688 [Paraphysoderma sedebokerense]|nr:hypothetical protein BKA69DRAFT_140688 [Paraphysoderma sedebokerense]